MTEPPHADPPMVFSPFVSSAMAVEPGWIDYNGHMNMAYYLVLFDRAVDEAFGLLGLGVDYVERRQASYFTAEIHTRYLRELKLGDVVRVTVQLVDHDEKRVHAYFEAQHHGDGWIAAVCEKLFLHVDMRTRRTAAFPPDILANLAAMRAAHAKLPAPTELGRSIGLRQAPRPRDAA